MEILAPCSALSGTEGQRLRQRWPIHNASPWMHSEISSLRTLGTVESGRFRRAASSQRLQETEILAAPATADRRLRHSWKVPKTSPWRPPGIFSSRTHRSTEYGRFRQTASSPPLRET